MRDGDDRIVLGQDRKTDASLLDGREEHGGGWKELLSVPLDKACRGRAEADDQVGRMFGKKSTEVVDEWRLRIVLTKASGDKRKFKNVERPW